MRHRLMPKGLLIPPLAAKPRSTGKRLDRISLVRTRID
jgi:hypothetical protein